MTLSGFMENIIKQCNPIMGLLPTNLSIIDCYFLGKAFSTSAFGLPLISLASDDIVRGPLWGAGEDLIELAYKLYTVDLSTGLIDWAVVDFNSRNFIIWDAHDRFVAVGGGEEFLREAMPYPQTIQRHFYIEGMAGVITQNEAVEVHQVLLGR